MRGVDYQQADMYSYLSPEGRVRADHPLRAVRGMADEAFALLVAVNDTEKTAAAYGNIGQVGDREIAMPEFGASAKQIALKGGSILLLHATDPAGSTARWLKERAEGILGVRIGVRDMSQARTSVGNKNVSASEQSVLVPPENAAGVWLQLQSSGQ